MKAVLIISEQGLHHLAIAGVSVGWLKAWLMSAGASEVSVALLESSIWRDSEADWQLFYGSEAELNTAMQHCELNGMQRNACFSLDNPPRTGGCFKGQGKRIVFLPLGDIAYQRYDWLSRFNGEAQLLPLYVRADDSFPIVLEPGLSASLTPPNSEQVLNAEGMLIEEQAIAALRTHRLSVRTVESCTAGGIAARLCRVPGASDVVDRGWVTYSNQAKQDAVGVKPELIEQYGAVSEKVVAAMAEGGADAAHVCIAVSGIAGPGGGSPDKPVGTVWIALALPGRSTVRQCVNLSGSRQDIQSRTVIAALNLLIINVDKLYRS